MAKIPVSGEARKSITLDVDPQIADSHVLLQGSSPSIHTGYNQSNLLAVVADGSSFASNADLLPL